MSFARAWKLVSGWFARRSAGLNPKRATEQKDRESAPQLSARTPDARALDARALGARGERMAVEYLRRSGYRIAATNFTAPIGRRRDGRVVTGEVDIIAYDATTDPPTLAFIEVKTRSSDALAAPASAVDRRKQRRIVRTARLYRRLLRLGSDAPIQNAAEGNPPRPEHPYRYDVIGIVARPGREARIEIHRGFFTEEVFRRSRWLSREEWEHRKAGK